MHDYWISKDFDVKKTRTKHRNQFEEFGVEAVNFWTDNVIMMSLLSYTWSSKASETSFDSIVWVPINFLRILDDKNQSQGSGYLSRLIVTEGQRPN